MKKSLTALLFYGAAWGFCEATLGFVLHRAAVALPGLPGALMFPVGFFFMRLAVQATGRASSALQIAAVAAAVKLADFLVPGADPIRVVNPALSILMEGLAVAVLCAPRSEKRGILWLRVLGAGVLWRALFALYLYAISLFGLPAGLVTSGVAVLLRFVLLESAVNAAVIVAGMDAAFLLPRLKEVRIRPAAAGAALLLAIIAHAAL